MIEIALRRRLSNVVANRRVVRREQGKIDRGWRDKAGFSPLNFVPKCLSAHCFDRSRRSVEDQRAAHFPIIFSFKRSESRRPRQAADRAWQPYLRRRRYFHAAPRGPYFLALRNHADFQSSSDGAQRRRLSHPSRQGPRIVAGR